MTIAVSMQKHLIRVGVKYELIEHTRTLDSAHTAQAAHILGAKLAKGRPRCHPQALRAPARACDRGRTREPVQ